MKYLFYILIFSFYDSAFSQNHLYDSNNNEIVYFNNKVVLDSQHQVLYNYKGYILFDKLQGNKNDIILTFDIRKNKTSIFNKVETIPTWILKNNKVIWKYDNENIDIISIVKENGFTSFYNIYTDSLIGYIDSEEVLEIELNISFYLLWELFKLEKIFISLSQKNTFSEKVDEGITGSITLISGGESKTWLWNGEYFFPKHNNDQRLVWEYDGETIKPIWNSRTENEWSWDGDELKPYWGGHPRNNWRWENGVFRQIFENNYRNEYEIVDNIVRKRFGSFGDIEWEIDGEIPLPLIGLLVLGAVYR